MVLMVKRLEHEFVLEIWVLRGPMRHAMDLGYLKEVGLKVGKIIHWYPQEKYPIVPCKTQNLSTTMGSKSRRLRPPKIQFAMFLSKNNHPKSMGLA